MLLHYLRKCSCLEIASFHSNAVSLLASFKQSLLDFFKLLDSRLILIGLDLTGILGGRMAGLTIKVLL